MGQVDCMSQSQVQVDGKRETVRHSLLLNVSIVK